jgi:hypothetical protein
MSQLLQGNKTIGYLFFISRMTTLPRSTAAAVSAPIIIPKTFPQSPSPASQPARDGPTAAPIDAVPSMIADTVAMAFLDPLSV